MVVCLNQIKACKLHFLLLFFNLFYIRIILSGFFVVVVFIFVFLLFFSGLHLWHMEVPRRGVK